MGDRSRDIKILQNYPSCTRLRPHPLWICWLIVWELRPDIAPIAKTHTATKHSGKQDAKGVDKAMDKLRTVTHGETNDEHLLWRRWLDPHIYKPST